MSRTWHSKKPTSRAKARRAAMNNRQFKLFSRVGDCWYCPPNHNENHRGSHSKWGRKVASKTAYALGKQRSEAWRKKPWWDLQDRHYKNEY